MGWECSDVARFDLGPLLQGQTRIAKLKSAYNSLNIDPRDLQCETNVLKIMGWESFDVVRFDLSPSFKVNREQPNLKVLITHLLLVLEVWDGKPTYRKSWDVSFLMWSDLTFDPSFKVKRG